MIISVARSPLRLLTMALVAVPMILLALDMSVTYRFFPRPATTEVVVGSDTDPDTGSSIQLTEDVLTRDGEAQRRREIAFSLIMAAGGVGMLGWAAKDLLAPKRLIEADDDGILLDVTRRGEAPVRLLWEDVTEIRSGAITDDAGTTPALVIRVEDPDLLPERPYGAVVEGDEIRLYSEEWERSAQDVAATLSLRVTRARGTGEVPQA
ncbi:MAG TPA: hypothetical protein VLD62_08840 [Acidimicrobiia bacterium]|nr:hypothetical protein [Acidimicrobiia bacterium]